MMKKTCYLFFVLILSANLSAQELTADLFTTPVNTGSNMSVYVNAPILDQFAGGQIGAFYDLDGDGTLECVGLEFLWSNPLG